MSAYLVKHFCTSIGNRERFSDWQVVVIYPSHSLEQSQTYPYQNLLNSERVHRVYLNELGEMSQLSLGVAAMVLTIVEEAVAPEQARMLVERAKAVSALSKRQGIIEMVSTIMVYKFTNLSRQEIEAMLGTKLEETRVYREAREEERQAIALNLLKQRIALEVIAQATGLTIAQLQQLQASQQQE